MLWMAQQGLTGIILRGPAEQERDLQELQDSALQHWLWVDQMPLDLLAALLTRCQVVVGHDSGVTHLAAAVGTTTLALFGPTDPGVWGPRSPRACVLQPQSPDRLTLKNLPPQAVIQTLAALLSGNLSFHPSHVGCTILSP
jgi:ADP-heptose:LPS heptosyltransferase